MDTRSRDRSPYRHDEMPMGANPRHDGVDFTVWAPAASTVEVELIRDGAVSFHRIKSGGGSVFSGFLREGRPGNRYRFRLDGRNSYPDPYSRFQPEGVHGPSEIVDPSFDWHDSAWNGLSRDDLVIYECHVGTYTPAGTFDALIPELRTLKGVGVTALELMPVGEFPGDHNWGYDGVDIYAPSRSYGGVTDLKRLVEAAHGVGIGVVLDVVYNHLGPDGNYLRAYAPDYFTDRYQTPWGEAFNFDGPNSHWVREYVIRNAVYWLTEYHLDGLRLDATHAIFDSSNPHVLQELVERSRGAVGENRGVVLMAENEKNDVRVIQPESEAGYGLDAVWADDFHHSLRVFLTGQREGYFADFSGTIGEIAYAIENGFIYQGQIAPRHERPRGTQVRDEPASSFVFCIQNHDQVGNRPFGERLNHLVDISTYGVASTLFLTVPETPMLFMGQEFAASTPFLYFTDHLEELGRLVTAGRRVEFSYMEGFKDPVQRDLVPDPQSALTFFQSKLRLEERWEHYGIYRLYKDLLRLRRTDPVLSIPDRARTRALPISDRAIAVLRSSDAGQRLILANFGDETQIPFAQLFDGELRSLRWRTLLATTALRYGGVKSKAAISGREAARTLRMPASAAVIFAVE